MKKPDAENKNNNTPAGDLYDEIFWPRFFSRGNTLFFLFFPLLLPVLVVRVVFFLAFVLFFRLFRVTHIESEFILRLFSFLCLGLWIRRKGNLDKVQPRSLVVMNHVHYLDKFAFKGLGLHAFGTLANGGPAKKFLWIDRMVPIRAHRGRLVQHGDGEGYHALIKGVREGGESYGICPEGTVKKDHRAVLCFHASLFKIFEQCVPVSIEYTYLISFRYGYQYPAYFLMDYLGVMLSPLTLCTVRVHDAIKIDRATAASAAEEARQVITRAIGGYTVDFYYTHDDYQKRLTSLEERRRP